jgi:uncharacterized lipoprotein NlpE involved in copper resistance
MKKSFLIVACLGSLLSCNNPSENKSSTNETTNMIEGKDYVILKRFRVVDNQGFNQPVEVSSFLLPANWQVNSDVQWNADNKCIPEMLQASLQASSPDKAFELTMFPATQFDWSDDPVYLDAMQRGYNLHSCHISEPLDAAGFINQALASSMKAQVKSVKPMDEVQQKMDEGAMQMTNTARQAGNNAYSHRGFASEGLLQFDDGKEGIALCTLMQTVTTISGTQGGMSNTYQCYVSMQIVMKYVAGNEAMARKILSTFLGSAKMNPQWSNSVQAIFADIGRKAQIEIGNRIEIARQAQEEIGKNITRNWERINSNSANSSSSNGMNTEGFSQYLRGVDSWTDDTGNKVELSSGYTNAWSKGDGSYLLSNNPAFDPNVAFNESWSRLKQ